MFALEPFAAVADLSDVDAILQDVGKGTISEANAAPIFGDLSLATLGDNAVTVEVGNQLAEGCSR